MNQANKDYEKLHALSRHARTLYGIKSLLEWDQETFMPAQASQIRAEQIKTLAGLCHKEMTSKKFSEALKNLINIQTGEITQEGLTPSQKVALKEWRKHFLQDRALPNTFVEKLAKHSAESTFIWEKAKKENNFKVFLPYLQKTIDMCKKKADYLGFEEHPYDALLDQFEPYTTKKEIKNLFDPLQKAIVKLLKKIQDARQVKDDFLTDSAYNKNKQLRFNEVLLKIIDYSPKSGRLDISVHPFSSSCHPTDSRITTRIHPGYPLSNLRSVLHECGHAFYEMNLPIEHYGSPLGEAISYGIHESQSRWWETRIGMSKAFWKYLLPRFKEHFKGKVQSIGLDEFWKGINKVQPSMIRVESDEVTYALHIILRFELEVALIEGTLAAKEIPEAWNAKMQELLGITPKDNQEGCLQDVHWSMGAFGYFPSYSLGNLYAAHFFQAFEKDHADWEVKIAKGDFEFMKDWLAKSIHCHGKSYTSKELLKKVSGKTFSSKAFEKYLEEKYHEIYGL